MENIKTWNGGGGIFLYKEHVNGMARIHENDRERLERLLRYCARPPFALERIKQQPDGTLIYFNLNQMPQKAPVRQVRTP